jgi:benzylsuccinate CoA-transferase BbsF subunit
MVENFSSPVLRKYGLSYDHVRAARPDLVFCSASGVGRTGPQSDVLAYGTLLQGYSGRAAMIGEINADLERMGIVPAWTDPVTAMWEALAILAALHHRRKTGEGAFIDLSMLEATVSLMPEALLRAALGDEGESSGGNREPDAAPSGCFACAGDDKWLALSVRTDGEWQALAAVAGLDAGRYPDAAARLAAKAELNAAVAAWLKRIPAEEAETRLQAAGVPSARTRSMGDLLEDPHLTERGVFPHTEDGSRTIALPWSDEEGWRGRFPPAPALGGDNDYVFGTLLGLGGADIARLKQEGVIR